MELPIPRLSHNYRIERLDGTVYDMADNGILVTSFVPDSPSPKHNRIEMDGVDGFIDGGTTYEGRTIHADHQLWSTDIPDFSLFRDELFRIFDSKEPFYIINDAEPGKRYLAKIDSKYSITQKSINGKFSIDFTSCKPYAESRGRTDTDPIDMNSDMWQMVGAGITLEDDLNYLFTTNSFKVFNGGDVLIDPRDRNCELIIQFKGASNGLTITNNTTGDSFQYTSTTTATDTITLNGGRILKNSSSDLRNSNRKLIKLATGWNDFTISGTTGAFQIIFGFRWLYL